MKLSIWNRALFVMLFFVSACMTHAESITINLTQEGSLAEKVLEQASSLAAVSELTVTGTINTDDWDCITIQMTGLKTLNLEGATASFETVSTINQYVTHFDMPKGIKTINNMSSNNLQELNFNDDLENIAARAFCDWSHGHPKFTELVFPSSILFIGYEAFRYCEELTTVDMRSINGENVTLEKAIFSQCRKLQTAYLPDGLTTISGNEDDYESDGLFSDCCRLETVDLPKSLKRIGGGTFYYCNSLRNIIIPENVETIGAYAFMGCENLNLNNTSDKIRSIGRDAFNGCKSMTSISLPNTLKIIGDRAFYGCSSISELYLPDSLSNIGSYAFANCNGLSKVTSLAPIPIAASGNSFLGINNDNCTLVVQEWSELLYKLAPGWSEFINIVTVPSDELSLQTLNINSKITFPESVRPNGTPNVFISENGCLKVEGNESFNVNELTMNAIIGTRYDYSTYSYRTGIYGSGLFNDGSNITAQSAKLGIKSEACTWGFITLPFDAELSDIMPMVEGDINNFIWKTYDGERRALVGTGGNWKEVTGTLKAGIGYIYQSQFNDSIYVNALASSLSKMLGCDDITLPLITYTANDIEDESWNFIGNPYPTYFNTHYIDFAAPITVWNGRGYDAISLADDDYTLAPFQAFFVQKQLDTDNIRFFAAGRTTDYSYSNNYYNNYACIRLANNTTRNIVNINLEGNEYRDKTRIVFNEIASMDYELNCDATKFLSRDVPQIYSIDFKERQLAINERPEGSGIVYLGIMIPKAGKYTISMDKRNQVNPLYLIDKTENIITEITTTDYTFYSDAETSNNRFILSPYNDGAGIIENEISSSNVSFLNGTIIVTDACGQKIEIYQPDGKCIYNAVVKNQTETISMPKGVYIVKVGDNSLKTYIK